LRRGRPARRRLGWVLDRRNDGTERNGTSGPAQPSSGHGELAAHPAKKRRGRLNRLSRASTATGEQHVERRGRERKEAAHLGGAALRRRDAGLRRRGRRERGEARRSGAGRETRHSGEENCASGEEIVRRAKKSCVWWFQGDEQGAPDARAPLAEQKRWRRRSFTSGRAAACAACARRARCWARRWRGRGLGLGARGCRGAGLARAAGWAAAAGERRRERAGPRGRRARVGLARGPHRAAAAGAQLGCTGARGPTRGSWRGGPRGEERGERGRLGRPSWAREGVGLNSVFPFLSLFLLFSIYFSWTLCVNK
jgi:hypothetical protein